MFVSVIGVVQSLSQYLKQHENAYLDRDSQPSEPSEIFHQVEQVPAAMHQRENNGGGGGNNNKRPYPMAAVAAMSTMADGYYETGYAADMDYQQPCVKRPNLSYPLPFMYHPHLHPQELPPPPPPPPTLPPSSHHSYSILPLLHIREPEDQKGHVEDEWKNIHVVSSVCNCCSPSNRRVLMYILLKV